MTVIGPYRLLRTLGTSEAGKVWSAFDAEGTSVTVAVIDGPRGASESWLRSFGHRTEQLAASEQLAIVSQDLTGAPAWIACAWDGDHGAARLFTASGLSYTPAFGSKSATPTPRTGVAQSDRSTAFREVVATPPSPDRSTVYASRHPEPAPAVPTAPPAPVPPVQAAPLSPAAPTAPPAPVPPVQVAPRPRPGSAFRGATGDAGGARFTGHNGAAGRGVRRRDAACDAHCHAPWGTAGCIVVRAAARTPGRRAAPTRDDPIGAGPARAAPSEPVRPEPPRAEPVRPDPPRPEPVRSGSVYGSNAAVVPGQRGVVVPDLATAEIPLVTAPPPPTAGYDFSAPPKEPAGPPVAAGAAPPEPGRDPSTAWQEIDEPVVAPVYLSENAASSRSAARRGRRRRRRGGRVFAIVLLVLMLLGAAAGLYVAKVGPIDLSPGSSQTNP